MSVKMLKSEMGMYTEKEIFGQPKLWDDVYQLILSKKDGIDSFLSPLLKKDNLRIILTGAGSSAFIGEVAQGIVQTNTKKLAQAIATTDLVTHPELFLMEEVPTLLVSFARSGNSPESLEAVKLADCYCENLYHLVITCNKEGTLAHYKAKEDNRFFCLVLPEESNDQSLAMTGSFTSMLLSVLLISDIQNIESNKTEIEKLVLQGKEILGKEKEIEAIASKDFDRVVFLGSGPMLGIARECHLKLQELTDGKVICKHDSFLGFRHGPRAVVTENTLIVYLFSNDDHVYRYERDLVVSIAQDPRNIKTVSLGKPVESGANNLLSISFTENPEGCLNSISATLIGQLLGYYKSLYYGLNPDNPSISGAISRVVQGVVIYDHPNKKCEQ